VAEVRVINVRNVHQALPRALQILDDVGVRRDSRNGPVVMVPGGVTTVYEKPCERVVFWSQRDANPAFHLYESLWMLAGRNDIAPLVRYAKNMTQFSDDGKTQHGAYGHRWLHWGHVPGGWSQLAVIARRLKEDPEDRRCVLQMWDPDKDLDRPGKDVPCNTTATFQRDAEGRLDLTVFCRSNDIIWGAYGANAVHMSMLLEYMANWIGCSVGTYTQVSVNWHAYVDKYEELDRLPRPGIGPVSAGPYATGEVECTTLTGDIQQVDRLINDLLINADMGFGNPPFLTIKGPIKGWPWVFYCVLRAHHKWRILAAPKRYIEALAALNEVPYECSAADWIVAMREWIMRRHDAWKTKMEGAK